MKKKTKAKLKKFLNLSYSIIIKLVFISIGSILVAISYNALIIPYGLLAGGISGIAILLHYLFDFPVYLGILLLNIPIFIWGLKELNSEFIFYSLVGAIVLVIALPLTKPFIGVPKLDMILVAIFSGIVVGLGSGIILRFGASTGGTDIISVIMKKNADIPVGSFLFFVNAIILAASTFFFNLNITLYTVISLWVSSKIVDYVLYGIYRKKSLIIISEKGDIIAERIMNDIHRGVTFIKGEGGFSKKNKLIVNTVVNNFENAKIRKILEEVDPKAFMYIMETAEVSGKGFTIKK